MKRLYQWFSKRASVFRSGRPGQGTTRTVCTEVTVRREGMTLLMGAAAAGVDTCPFCGQKLVPEQAEQAKLRLLEGSTPREDLPADGTST
jgi:hypothetical protein